MLSAVSANAPEESARRPRRARVRMLVAVAVAMATLLAVSGCSQFDQALGQQEEVVIFQSNVTNAVKLKVRDACDRIPGDKVEALPTDHKLSDEVYDVRFEVGSATNVELAELQQCLSKFPAVVGLETDTPGGDD
jgi:hypothetical protein